jgi:hypothetical protein
MAQSYAVGFKKKNGAQHSAMMLLDVSAQCVQDFGERTLAHDHGQHALIEERQSLGGLLLLGG